MANGASARRALSLLTTLLALSGARGVDFDVVPLEASFVPPPGVAAEHGMQGRTLLGHHGTLLSPLGFLNHGGLYLRAGADGSQGDAGFFGPSQGAPMQFQMPSGAIIMPLQIAPQQRSAEGNNPETFSFHPMMSMMRAGPESVPSAAGGGPPAQWPPQQLPPPSGQQPNLEGTFQPQGRAILPTALHHGGGALIGHRGGILGHKAGIIGPLGLAHHHGGLLGLRAAGEDDPGQEAAGRGDMEIPHNPDPHQPEPHPPATPHVYPPPLVYPYAPVYPPSNPPSYAHAPMYAPPHHQEPHPDKGRAFFEEGKDSAEEVEEDEGMNIFGGARAANAFPGHSSFSRPGQVGFHPGLGGFKPGHGNFHPGHGGFRPGHGGFPGGHHGLTPQFGHSKFRAAESDEAEESTVTSDGAAEGRSHSYNYNAYPASYVNQYPTAALGSPTYAVYQPYASAVPTYTAAGSYSPVMYTPYPLHYGHYSPLQEPYCSAPPAY